MAWIIAVRTKDGDDAFAFYDDDAKKQMQHDLVVDMKFFTTGYLAKVKKSWGNDDESS